MSKAGNRKSERRAIVPSSSTASLFTADTKGCEAPDARSETLPSLGARSAARSMLGGPERATDQEMAPFGAAHSQIWCSRRRSTEDDEEEFCVFAAPRGAHDRGATFHSG